MAPGLSFLARNLSPIQFNPFNLNPLREALIAEVDFAHLRDSSAIKLLVGATRVRDGRLRVFTNADLTVDAVLASTCLPLLHRTVEVDGEPYWDGGYVANPPLIPLALATDASDILVVQVTPAISERLPTTPTEIKKRLEQIQFNASLNADLEALKLGFLLHATPQLRRLRIDRLSAQEEFEGLEEQSAGNLSWSFLQRLQQSGRNAADAWLEPSATNPLLMLASPNPEENRSASPLMPSLIRRA